MVLADVLARWNQWRHRGWSSKDVIGGDLQGGATDTNQTGSQHHDGPEAGETQVVFATGTDEHGSKIQKAAEKLGETPRRLCDRVSRRFKDLADAAGIGYTRFIRTTDEDHVRTVKALWHQLLQDGFIYKGTHSGWYSVVDEAFYTTAQVKESEEDGKQMVSIETGNAVEWTEEENYKFRLAMYEEPLRQWLKANPAQIVPHTRYMATLNELDDGLQDLSISRPKSRLEWGIDVPNDTEQTMYVWFDALLNYVTVSGYPWHHHDGRRSTEEVATTLGSWPADAQIVGKDIIRFHAIYFPAFLMALGLPLPRQLVTHGHWTVNMSKMSKSKGNAVDPFVALNTVGQDELRFFLTRIGGNLAKDVNWNDDALVDFRRKHLQSQYGNLLSRVLAPAILNRLILKGQDSVVLPAPTFEDADEKHLELLRPLTDIVDGHMARFELSVALTCILDMLESSQKHWHSVQAWLPADSSPSGSDDVSMHIKEKRLWRGVYLSMESCRIAALLSRPVMPQKMDALLDALDIIPAERTVAHSRQLRDQITIHRRTEKIAPLFPALSTGAQKVLENGPNDDMFKK